MRRKAGAERQGVGLTRKREGGRKEGRRTHPVGRYRCSLQHTSYPVNIVLH
jgi:hypothetical protein